MTTDGGGSTPFTATLPTEVPAGQVVTATATDSDGNTSEFSSCRTATGAPAVSVGDTTVAEDGGSATVHVRLDGPSARTVTVDYATAPGSASAGADYTTTGGTVTFAPGETSTTVSIPIVDDDLEESPPETFTVELSNPHEATIADGSGVVSIADNDPSVFVVNSNADSSDGACTAAPGNCTLREAILAANASPGPARIEFQIGPGGAQTIAVASPLPPIDDPVTIDGQTEPGFMGQPLIEVSAAPGVGPVGIDVEASSTIRGLVVDGFSAHGILLGRGHSKVEGVTVKGNGDSAVVVGSPGNRIGGTTPAQRNVISGNGAGGLWVTDLNGQQASGNTIVGNLIAGNGGTGVTLDAGSNAVLGNLIGTDSTGSHAAGNSAAGVAITSGDNAIGDGTAAGRNVISGNGFEGIWVKGGTANRIRGNYIGTDATGTAALGNRTSGIAVIDAPANVIGGPSSGDGNLIADNPSGGVVLSGSTTRTTIARNAIYANGGLGIDLKADGVTANDDLDADSGPNGLQNTPDLSAATAGGGQVGVSGVLRSEPSKTYSVELFTEPACDPSGHGQGRDYLGTVSVTTDNSGAGSFTRSAASSASAGDVVTATATDADGNTSEFSGCLTVTDAPAVSAGDVSAGESDGSAVVPVTLSRPSARTVTVHYASADDSAQAGSDYEATSGTLTFAPGETRKDVHVPITSDSLDERDERFTLELSDPVEATVGDGTGVVTIADDDAAPSLAIADSSVAEGTGGTTNATFAVTLSAPSGKTVTVDADTADGSATAPDDYSAAHVVLSFAPGETTKDVNVPIVADNASEPDESFRVALGSEANADVTRRQATGKIHNDDAPPAPSAPQQQQQPRDDLAPGLTLGALPGTVSRAALLHNGLKLDVTLNEPVSLDVQLLARPRFLHGARSGDVVLARTKLALGSGKRTVKLKVLRKLRRGFTRHPAQLRVSVLATDAAGNRTRVLKTVTVR